MERKLNTKTVCVTNVIKWNKDLAITRQTVGETNSSGRLSPDKETGCLVNFIQVEK